MVLSEAGAGGVGLIQYCIENLIIHPRVPARQWKIMTECYLRLGHKVRERKVCADERNNSQHCWPNNVGTSCIRHLHGAKRLISFKLCATEQLPKTSNNMQQGVQTNATCSIQQCWEFICWPTMLRPFAQGFKQQRRRRLRERYLKSGFPLLQTLSRLFC